MLGIPWVLCLVGAWFLLVHAPDENPVLGWTCLALSVVIGVFLPNPYRYGHHERGIARVRREHPDDPTPERTWEEARDRHTRRMRMRTVQMGLLMLICIAAATILLVSQWYVLGFAFVLGGAVAAIFIPDEDDFDPQEVDIPEDEL